MLGVTPRPKNYGMADQNNKWRGKIDRTRHANTDRAGDTNIGINAVELGLRDDSWRDPNDFRFLDAHAVYRFMTTRFRVARD